MKQFQSTALVDPPIVWKSADGVEYKLHQMSPEHMINIIRQMTNEVAKFLGLDPVPIREPRAVLNFHKISWARAIRDITFFAAEIQRRIDRGDKISPSYFVIWEQVCFLGRQISTRVNASSDLRDKLLLSDDPIWDSQKKLNENSYAFGTIDDDPDCEERWW